MIEPRWAPIWEEHVFGSSPEMFWAQADEPLVVWGLDLGGGWLSFDRIAAGAAGTTLRVWDWERREYDDEPVGELVARALAGDTTANVTDQPIGDTALGAALRTPFWNEGNWFADTPGYEAIQLELLLTAVGAWTQPHVDGCFGGWAQLLAGEKEWWFWAPEARDAMFDVPMRRFPEELPETFPYVRARQRPGETVVFPPGWVHAVRTTEASFSLAGSVVNEWGITASMDWWLVETVLGMGGRLDLPGECRRRLDRFEGRQRADVADALARAEEYAASRWAAPRLIVPCQPLSESDVRELKMRWEAAPIVPLPDWELLPLGEVPVLPELDVRFGATDA